MNQYEWVAGCQRYYAENWLEPGNPEDGIWHDCHYPTPACLGGTETVKLLKEHHAVQGVLQSEEFGHPCIHSWEKSCLPAEYLELYQKWVTNRTRMAARSRTKSMLEQGTLHSHCSALGKIGGSVTWNRREGFFKDIGTEKWIQKSSEAGKKGCQITNAQRWKCRTTGYISTAAGVVRYQSLRNIDTSPSNRERIS